MDCQTFEKKFTSFLSDLIKANSDKDIYVQKLMSMSIDMDNEEYVDASTRAINKAPDDGACSLYGNVIMPYLFDYNQDESQKYRLNNIVFQNEFSEADLCYFECYGNKIGYNSRNITFGNDCNYITFGNNCWSLTFGNGCSDITFGNYYRGCSAGEYVNNIQINCSTGSSNYLQYFHILNGTNNVTIPFVAGKKSSQYAGLNSSGTLKVWIPADNV